MDGPSAGSPGPDRRRGRRFGWHRGPGLWSRGPAGSGPLRRARQDRLVGGVAAGLATRTGWDVMVIRLLFVLATLLSIGVPIYVVAWLLVPMEGEDSSIATKALTDLRGLALAAGLGSLLVVVLVIASVVGAGWLGNLAWPLVIGVSGLTLIWRNASADEQMMMRRLAEPLLDRPRPGKRSATVLRALAATVLLASGLAILLSGHAGAELLAPLGGVILVVAAIVVILGPWWLRIALNLVAERQARVRAEERADMAARVHDSVLQTLALIQRNADQPAQVVKLARGQERELRSWLFGGSVPGEVRGQGTTLAAGVRSIQQEVEALHGVTVEAVTVGDCGLDDQLDALLGAAREATVNAAKWSGADVISLFAEVEPAEVSVFVRDRGCGFDPEAVPSDRKGLAESVCARMTRRGGSVAVRSVLGNGTEISLRMPRVAGPRQPSRA